jgi:hypothetical protein
MHDSTVFTISSSVGSRVSGSVSSVASSSVVVSVCFEGKEERISAGSEEQS